MPRAKLTDRALNYYKPTEKPVEYWDTVHKGFGVRVNPTGKKTFFVRYSFGGRRRRVMLGPYPFLKLHEAREKAKEVICQVVRGIDPQAKDEDITFAELAEHYLELHAKPKKRSWREDERMIKKELLPEWGSVPTKEIQRRDLIRILDGIMDRGAPTTANRTRGWGSSSIVLVVICCWQLRSAVPPGGPCAPSFRSPAVGCYWKIVRDIYW